VFILLIEGSAKLWWVSLYICKPGRNFLHSIGSSQVWPYVASKLLHYCHIVNPWCILWMIYWFTKYYCYLSYFCCCDVLTMSLQLLTEKINLRYLWLIFVLFGLLYSLFLSFIFRWVLRWIGLTFFYGSLRTWPLNSNFKLKLVCSALKLLIKCFMFLPQTEATVRIFNISISATKTHG